MQVRGDNMRRMLLVLLVLFLVGCESRPVTGTVMAKDYDPEHWIPMTNCTTINKRVNCNTTHTYDDEDWTLYVCNEEDGCVWVEVEEGVYLTLEEGSSYNSCEYERTEECLTNQE